MSHTASMSTDDAILDAAFERAGIIRIDHLRDFVTTAKAFALPPMRGNRIMVMSPAGGLGVAMADLCERQEFAFADPGPVFFEELAGLANAGIIKLQNPLDMGDLYQIDKYPSIFNHVLANDQVDGAIFASQRPRMPIGGEDVFTAMFNADLTLAVAGAVRSAAKPLALVLYGDTDAVAAMKAQSSLPIFDGPEEAIAALRRQRCFHAAKTAGPFQPDPAGSAFRAESARCWLHQHSGIVGEEALELLGCCGIDSPPSGVAQTAEEAGQLAQRFGCPVVLKVVSPEAVHKTEVGGVLLDVNSPEEASHGFDHIRANLERYRPGARFDGVRVAAMAPAGHDLFIGGLQDQAFGPVVLFGSGGIHVEILQDMERVLAPSSLAEITEKIGRLRAARLFTKARGREPVDPAPFARAILTVARLLAEFPQIAELDLNPVRLLDRGGLLALDGRLRIIDV
jgi:acetyltransferase